MEKYWFYQYTTKNWFAQLPGNQEDMGSFPATTQSFFTPAGLPKISLKMYLTSAVVTTTWGHNYSYFKSPFVIVIEKLLRQPNKMLKVHSAKATIGTFVQCLQDFFSALDGRIFSMPATLSALDLTHNDQLTIMDNVAGSSFIWSSSELKNKFI